MKTIWESDGIEEPVLICCPPEKTEEEANYCQDCDISLALGMDRCSNCAAEQKRKDAASFVVAVYLVDQAYGGGEEGGWWFQTGELVRAVKVCRREEQAQDYCMALNDRLYSRKFGPNKGRRSISSVLSDGEYVAKVFEGTAPAYFPDRKPHYE